MCKNAFLLCTLPLTVLLLMFGIKDAGISTTSAILCKIFDTHSQFIVMFGIKASYVTLLVSQLLADLLFKKFLLLLLTHCDVWYQRFKCIAGIPATSKTFYRYIATTFGLPWLIHFTFCIKSFGKALVFQLLPELLFKWLWLLQLTHGDIWYHRFVYFADTSAISSF